MRSCKAVPEKWTPWKPKRCMVVKKYNIDTIINLVAVLSARGEA